MQEFLKNNTVNCNLMSLTGYRTLIILKALFESPKTNDEINECLFNNQYIQEKFSGDTLRMYINSLRAVGCEITRADKANGNKYKLLSHPFVYDIPLVQLKALNKLYKCTYDRFGIREIILIEDFFTKLGTYLQNESTRSQIISSSVLKQVDKTILKELLNYCQNKKQITFLYNSPKSGTKEITCICDKIGFKSGKLYLWGTNLTHKEYSFFLIERITKICSVQMLNSEEEIKAYKVIYEVDKKTKKYTPEPDEKIIDENSEKITFELTSKNEFSLMQRMLYKASDCKIIEPTDFKEKLIKKIELMKEAYEKN